jgi:hypothetical protein
MGGGECSKIFLLNCSSNERVLTAACSRAAHCPAFFKQPTPFSHIPFVPCTFTIHFNNLPVNFRRMNIFFR